MAAPTNCPNCCPNCNADTFVKNGMEKRSGRQRYLCKWCGKTFTGGVRGGQTVGERKQTGYERVKRCRERKKVMKLTQG